MASINGVEVRNLKTFKEHEGMDAYQGDVYMDGRKLGFWSQDYHGGITDDFHFRTDALEERVEAFKKGHPENYRYYPFLTIESLMSEIVNLAEDEQTYEQVCKKGAYILVMVTDGYHVSYFGDDFNPAVQSVTKEEIVELYAKQIEKMKEGMFKNKEAHVKVYLSPEDFNLCIDAEHPAPKWMLME